MSKIVKISIVILFVIYLISLWNDTKKPKTVTSNQSKENFKLYTNGYNLLKNKMKDSASFDVESACVMPNKTVCYKYKAKNSFGAFVDGLAFVTIDSFATSDQNGFNEAFKKECDMSLCTKIK